MTAPELDLDELQALEDAWVLISQAKMNDVASVMSKHSQAMGPYNAVLVNDTILVLLHYHAVFPQLIARLRAAEERVKDLEAERVEEWFEYPAFSPPKWRNVLVWNRADESASLAYLCDDGRWADGSANGPYFVPACWRHLPPSPRNF